MKNRIALAQLATIIVSFLLFLSQSLAAQSERVPPHIDLRVKLTGDNGEPLRNVRFQNLLFTIDDKQIRNTGGLTGNPNATTVVYVLLYHESHDDIWTNYDGYVELQIGRQNPADWSNINWLIGKPLHIRVSKGDPQRPGLHKNPILYDGVLPTIAYSQVSNNLHKPGIGEIDLFSDSSNPNIELRANGANHQGYIDFSFADASTSAERDFATRITTRDDQNLYFLTKGGLANFTFVDIDPAGRNEFDKGGRVRIDTKSKSAIDLFGFSPRLNFYRNRSGGDLSGRIFQSSRATNHHFEVGAFGQNLWLSADSNFNIIYSAEEHEFNGGPIIVHAQEKLGSEYCSTYGKKTASIKHDHDFESRYERRKKIVRKRLSFTESNKDPELSISADGGVRALAFYAISDMRVKAEHQFDSNFSAINILNNLTPHYYNYLDYLQHGNSLYLGFYGQQVEEHFPQAVSKNIDVIPDIMVMSKEVSFDSLTGKISVMLDQPGLDQCVEGEQIKILGDEEYILEVLENKDGWVTFSNWPERNTEQVFVYGHQVDDFRIVDYDQIFTLNVAATQELIKQVEALQAQVLALEAAQAENQQLRQAVDDLNIRLARIEASLQESTTNSSPKEDGDK